MTANYLRQIADRHAAGRAVDKRAPWYFELRCSQEQEEALRTSLGLALLDVGDLLEHITELKAERDAARAEVARLTSGATSYVSLPDPAGGSRLVTLSFDGEVTA